MGRCYCVIVETGKSRREREVKRKKRRKVLRKILRGGLMLLGVAYVALRYILTMMTISTMALGIGVILLAITQEPGISVVGTVILTFVLSVPLSEALME